jgi:hypothetical protein
MDYTSSFKLLYEACKYKKAFVSQFKKFHSVVSSANIGLKNIIQNTIDFFEEVQDNLSFDKFKELYLDDYNSKRLFKCVGYLITQQVSNL